MAEELKIFKMSYDFCQWLLGHTNQFPKSHRFSVAVRLENYFFDFLEKLVLANHRHNKIPLLIAADERLLLVRLLIRFSHDKKFIATSSYEFAVLSLTEIGRMLGGWIKQQSSLSKNDQPRA